MSRREVGDRSQPGMIVGNSTLAEGMALADSERRCALPPGPLTLSVWRSGAEVRSTRRLQQRALLMTRDRHRVLQSGAGARAEAHSETSRSPTPTWCALRGVGETGDHEEKVGRAVEVAEHLGAVEEAGVGESDGTALGAA